jgi:hypothetical protein
MDFIALGADSEQRQLNELASLFDAPAYIRRARGVEEALEQLLCRCRSQRETWLLMPRLHLGQLHDLAGQWATLLPLLADEQQLALLERLWSELSPKLRLPLQPTRSLRRLKRQLRELCSSLHLFNERWLTFIAQVDLSEVNARREGYNRYYVLEKACALRSDLLARHGFVPHSLMNAEELLAHLPTLPVPRLRD